MKVQTPHAADLVITAIIVASQTEIGWFLHRDWKNRISPVRFRLVTFLLYPFWGLVMAGLLDDLLGMQYNTEVIPAALSSFLSAVSIFWGFASTISINIYAAIHFLMRRREPFSPGRRVALQTATAAAMGAPFAVAGFGALIERTAFAVKEIDLPVPNLHPDLVGVRIAQISDLHVSPFLSLKEAAHAVDMTNELKAQLTLFTGDLITARGDPLDGAIRELGRLRADAGVLGCLGNHEVYAECQDYVTREAAKVGVSFLRHRAVPLKWGQGTLNVAGVDFQSFSRKQHYLDNAEQLILPGAANLLLSHNPDVFPVAVRKGYDAVVGGHTHGGQVTVEILNRTANLARFFTPFVAGLYRQDGRSCYVNAGIGTIGMPLRLGAPPEITLFRLRRA